MAARSPIMDGVSPALLNAIKRVGDNYGPYGVRITSGYRAGSGHSQHGRGKAIDVELYDKKTGKAVPNYQNAESAAVYQQFANAVYADAQKNDPALAAKLRWGGYFGNDPGTGKPRYGSLDLMHFDEAGHVGMRGGSWKEGFSPEMQKYWKIGAGSGAGAPAGGGPSQGPVIAAGGGAPAEGGVPGMDPALMKKALLASIARGESSGYGYDMMLGGGKISDLSKHPGVLNSSPYGSSTAAGKYQFLKRTWDEEAAKYGYKDFSPETQDTAAWNLARDVYKRKAGRDLETDLASGDANTLNNISSTLSGTWTSLPGGPQPNSNWKGKDFASVYNENLGAGDAGGGPAVAASGTGGVGSDAARAPAQYETDPSAVASTLGQGIGDKAKDATGDAFAALGDIFAKGPVAQNAARPSGPANLPVPMAPAAPGVQPIVDPRQAEMQRQQLAIAMQRLNSGKLF